MHQLIKNGLFLSAFTVVSLPLSYFIRLYLSQHLSITDYGFFYALIGFFGLLQSFNDLGFSETQIYFIPKYIAQERLDKIKAVLKTQLINQLATTFLIGLLLHWCAPWVSQTFFHTNHGTEIFRIFILFFIFNDFLQNVQILFFSHQEIEFSGSFEPVRMLLIALLLISSQWFFQFDLYSLAWIWVSVYGFLAVMFFVIFLIKHQDVLRAPNYPIKNIYQEFIPFILPTLFSNNIATLFSKGTETVLVLVKGVTDTAYYNIAKPVSNLALAVTAPVANLLKPFISQIDENQDKSIIKSLILLVLNTGVFIFLPFSILLAIYARESIIFLFGSKYVQATLTLRFMAFEIFFDVINTFVFGIVFGLGLQKKRAKVLYTASLICFVLSMVLIPAFGPVGVAIANLAYGSVGMMGAVYIIRQKIEFELPVKKYLLLLPLIGILVASQAALMFLTSTQMPQQLIVVIVKVIIGLGVYYSVGIFVFHIIDISTIWNLLNLIVPTKFKHLLSLGKRQLM